MKRAWRLLTRPVVSVADAALMASCVAAADAMHLGLHLAWGWVLVIVWGATIAAVFGIGFVKGFARSVAGDVRKWRESKNAAR